VTSPVGLLSPMPERVVATMTSEVLPPYSAGGAPGMTISDCTESMGIWLEKTLDCWSVMGWLSTEKELDAWSPMPWKRPLESAETPGEARVMSELTERRCSPAESWRRDRDPHRCGRRGRLRQGRRWWW